MLTPNFLLRSVSVRFKKFYPEWYDLVKTLTCGQLFRWYRLDERKFKLVSQLHTCIVQQDEVFGPVSVYAEDLDYWYNFLSLDDKSFDFASFYDVMHSTGILAEIYNYSLGIRILNQDPWEALAGFVISQRNNIPRIMQCVERIAARLGTPVDIDHNSFPSPQVIVPFSLYDCGLGYRESYLYSVSAAIRIGEIQLDALTVESGCSSDRALQDLERLHGVGYKVACCAALYGLGHRDIFPVDVWIGRAIDRGYISYDLIKSLGNNKGLVQQYLYYFMINSKFD